MAFECVLCRSLLHYEVQAADLQICPRYCFLVFHAAKLLQRVVQNFLDPVIHYHDAIVAGGNRTLEDARTDELVAGRSVTVPTPFSN